MSEAASRKQNGLHDVGHCDLCDAKARLTVVTLREAFSSRRVNVRACTPCAGRAWRTVDISPPSKEDLERALSKERKNPVDPPPQVKFSRAGALARRLDGLRAVVAPIETWGRLTAAGIAT